MLRLLRINFNYNIDYRFIKLLEINSEFLSFDENLSWDTFSLATQFSLLILFEIKLTINIPQLTLKTWKSHRLVLYSFYVKCQWTTPKPFVWEKLKAINHKSCHLMLMIPFEIVVKGLTRMVSPLRWCTG